MLKKFGLIFSLFILSNSLDIISISNNGKKEIQLPYENKQNNVTINMHSSDIIYYTLNSSSFYKNFYVWADEKYYIFEFAPELKAKYLKFGYRGSYNLYQTKKFSIYENDNIIYNETKKLVIEDYIETRSDYKYKIHLNINSIDIYFYLVLTDHLYILPVKKDTVNFQLFPCLETLNLSLNTSLIPINYKFRVQYRTSNTGISYAFGYYTDDYNEIENTKGIELKMHSHEKDYRIYNNSFYILKENSELKTVILKIRGYQPDSFEIRYSDQEPDPSKEKTDEVKKDEGAKNKEGDILFPLWLGLGLSLPNIIFQIFRKIFKKRTAPWNSLVMNIILHLAYSILLCYPFNYGSFISIIAGCFFLALSLLFCFACSSGDSNIKSIINQLKISSEEFEELPLLGDILFFNRKIPPLIMIKVNSQHKESREILKEYQPYEEDIYRKDIHVFQNGDTIDVTHFDHTSINFEHVNNHYSEWKRDDEGEGKIEGKPGKSFNSYVREKETKNVKTWSDDAQYIYTSWQDVTKDFLKKKDISIINATFDYKIIFSSSCVEAKKKIINKLCEEGKNHDTDVYYYDQYRCYGFILDKRCYISEGEYNRIKGMHQKKYYYIGLILFILGYSSIIESFFVYDEGVDSFIIEKLVSDENDCRAKYMKDDTNLPLVKYSYIKKDLEFESEEPKKFNTESNGTQISEPLLYK